MKEYHLKDFSIYIGSDSFDVLLENLLEASYTRVFVLVDEHTGKYCLPLLNKYLFDVKLIRIPSGEEAKSMKTVQVIWDEMLRQQADRKSVLINLGGGVVCDVGGFAAATFKRGCTFINIPTTLLAMVDAAIGGKLGVNYQGLKNAIGVFRHPAAIYVNPDFLKTLPQPEAVNGIAEMLKHALIADASYWEKLGQSGAGEWYQTTSPIIASVKIKTQIVKKDPFDRAKRKLLNFGHTIGHAVESYSLANDTKPLSHGEAVAIGMICESYLSKEVAGLSGRELRAISDLILLHFKKYSLKNILSPELIGLMKQDKKNESDGINFTLLKRIGKGSIDHVCSEKLITHALQYYENL